MTNTLFSINLKRAFFEIVLNKQDRERIATELRENDGKYNMRNEIQKQMAVLVMP
jgi:hypothetical protein